MKKKNIICVALWGTLLASSCSDYLNMEKDIKDRMTIEKVFASKDYTEDWLATAYSYLIKNNADMGYGGPWPFAFADDMYHPTYKEFKEQTYVESKWQDSYKEAYLGIRQATIFIQNVDQCQLLTENQRADYKAQARFVRAFYYWKLLQKYGPIPLVPDEGQDYTQEYVDLYLSRSTYDECANYIADEMALAARDLPLQRELYSVARPTRGAALAVRARVLLFAASPLMNGNTDAYAAELINSEGKQLLSAEYDEGKWAKAAAAALDVMELPGDNNGHCYTLYTAPSRVSADDDVAYPTTIKPYEDGNFSKKNWPEGYADIDPFESYRSVFNGELSASRNPELIFTRGQNQGDYSIKKQVFEQLPTKAKGKNRLCMTQKQCDAYYMYDGTDCPGKDSEIGRGDGSTRLTGFVTKTDVENGLYKPLVAGVSLQYANREPRFYASVAYNGAVWALQQATLQEDRGPYTCWYYHAGGERYNGGSNGGLMTGIGVMKFVRPTDTYDDGKGDHITNKSDVAIRYAEVLLIYAEALNELTDAYDIPSWDGVITRHISRTVEELKRGIQPIRIRAGVPDYESYVYSTPSEFRKKLKRERQIELMGEGHRYFDLRRWKDAATEESIPFYGCNTKMTEAEKELFHQPMRIDEVPVRFMERSYFWPFNIDELYRNHKLTQNPGWINSKY